MCTGITKGVYRHYEWVYWDPLPCFIVPMQNHDGNRQSRFQAQREQLEADEAINAE